MTYGWMKQRVQSWLGLQDESQVGSYGEGQMVANLLYEGTIDVLARTKCVVRCVQLRVTAGQSEYLLDHAILALVDVEDGWREKARRDQTPYQSNAIIVYPSGTDGPVSSSPSFTLIRSDVLRVQPTPSVDGTIQVWAVMRPQQMLADTDSPGMEAFGAIPDEWHDAIIGYALWKAADYTDDGGSQNGEYYRVLYEGQDGRGGRLAQIRMAANKRGTAKAPRRRVKLRGISASGSYVG